MIERKSRSKVGASRNVSRRRWDNKGRENVGKKSKE